MPTLRTFHTQYNVGRVRYAVSYHDGKKTHPDGSRFYDLATFGNKRAHAKFCADLKAQGYREAR